MTTNETPAPAGITQTLTCPECGEPARPAPPHEWEWLLSGWKPRPAFSHHDGTPLCPVIGPDGYEPADPIGAAPDTPADD